MSLRTIQILLPFVMLFAACASSSNVSPGPGGAAATQGTSGNGPEHSGAPASSLENGRDPADAPPSSSTGFMVVLTPDQDIYQPGETVTIDLIGATGRLPRETLDRAEWTVRPTAMAQVIEGGQLRFLSEGDGELQGCLDAVCDIIALKSNTRPSLVIQAPLDTSMLAGDSMVTVEGTALDPSDPLTVFVNGIPAVLDPDGHFAHEVELDFGVNTIEVTVADGHHMPPKSRILEVLWAPTYVQTDGTGGGLPTPIRVHVQQALLDGMTSVGHLGPGVHEVSTLGQAMEAFIQTIDFRAFLDTALFVENSNLRLALDDVRLQPASNADDAGLGCSQPTCVSMDIVDGGLDVDIRIPNLQLETTGFVTVGGETLSLDGRIEAALYGFVRIRLAIEDGALELTTENENLTVYRIDGTYEDPIIQSLLNVVDPDPQTLNQQVRRLMEALLLPLLRRDVKDLAGFAFEAINAAASSIPLTLYPLDPSRSPADFTIGIRPQELQFVQNVELQLASELRIRSALELQSRPLDLGVPMKMVSSIGRAAQQPANAYLDLAGFNLISHTLWRSGLLGGALPLPADIAPLVTRVELDPLFPPVVQSTRSGDDHHLIAQLGGYRVTIQPARSETSVLYGLTIEAGVDIRQEGRAFRAVITEDPIIRLRALSNDDALPLDPMQLTRLIHDTVWPSVRQNLHSVFLYDVSPVVLQDAPFGHVAPRLTTLSFIPTLGETIEVSNGRLSLGGRIALELEISP